MDLLRHWWPGQINTVPQQPVREDEPRSQDGLEQSDEVRSMGKMRIENRLVYDLILIFSIPGCFQKSRGACHLSTVLAGM